jgi:hypothetical protein
LESYSEEFKAGKLPYRDFDHALKHVMKATGKLVSMVEEADHGGESFPAQRTANYLADLVICAIRMASKHPYGPINIENAVIARVREKADVPIHKGKICYKSVEDVLREQGEKQLSIMNDLHSLLSLVLHRHLPRNLDSLAKDIEKVLSASEPVLRPWWDKQMNKQEHDRR